MQTINFEEFMTTEVDEFPEGEFATPGLSPRQSNALVMGARIAGCTTVEGLVDHHRTHNAFSGEVSSPKELRSFVSFHLARVNDAKREANLVRAGEQHELVAAQHAVQALTAARPEFMKTVTSMASELDEVLGGDQVSAHIRAEQLNFASDTTTMAWWAAMRRRIIAVALTVEGTEFGPELSRALHGGGPDSESGAEALASLSGPLGGSAENEI